MNLIERYVRMVGIQLPPARRDEVMSELRSLLQTQCDAREAELGRSLHDGDVEALLKEFGHPLRVASAYRERNFLIGPGLMPLYRMSLWIILAVVVLIKAVGLAMLLLGYGVNQIVQVRDVSQFVLQTLHGLVYAFGLVTLIFVLLEYWGEDGYSWQRYWQPRRLPQFNAGPASSVRRLAVAVEMVFLISFGLLLNGFITRNLWSWQRQPSLFSEVVTSPTVHWLLIPMNLVILLGLCLGMYLLLRGVWSRTSRLLHIGLNLLALLIVVLLIQHPQPLTWAVDATTGPRYTSAVLAALNRSVHLTLAGVGLLLVYSTVSHVYQLWQAIRGNPNAGKLRRGELERE